MAQLIKEQSKFVQDIIRLLSFIYSLGFEVTLGEAYRTIEQQEIYVKNGKSKTMNSMHLKRLALDLNFFKDNKLITSKVELQDIGDYWEILDRLNKWGGNFNIFIDTPHFQRTI